MNSKRVLPLRLLPFALLLSAPRALAQSPVPLLRNFQGRMAKPNGSPVADGAHNVQFALWNDAASTDNTKNLMWQTSAGLQ
ncbi:hypothetical protein ABTJ55_19910, partial [Acinetobacter baumannii]